MKKILSMAFCAIAFILIAAPIYMNQPAHAVFINGKPFGNAVTINRVLAISLDDFANAISGTPNLQQAGLTLLNGNRLLARPLHLEASNSADTFTRASPRDAASRLPTGKRMHKPITSTQEGRARTPTLNGEPFLPLSERARGFGGTR